MKREVIQFALGYSTIGAILVAASPQGLCSVSLGNDVLDFKKSLQQRFPDALIEEGHDREIQVYLSKVIELVDNPFQPWEMALDERGTDFQRRVWQALRAIPPGTTNSYSEIAKKIGSSQSARAVAGACAANPLVIVTPCHRVIRNDGTLSGFRSGVENKIALLNREKAREFNF